MPIARREMLLLAKSRIMYRSRLVTGIVTLVVGIGFSAIYSRFGMGTAVPFTGFVGYILGLMCLFIGAQLTADSIAKERREGTLGLLFLTGLGSWQITVGKLIANGLSAFFAVIVTFPLAALLLITGGVAPLEVLRVAITVLNTLFTTACIGLLVSTFTLEQKRAMGRATMLVMLFWWGLPMLALLLSRLGAAPWIRETLLLFSLNSVSFSNTFTLPGSASAHPWLAVLGTHLLGWSFVLLATLLLPRQWRDKPERKKFSLSGAWKRLSFGNAKVRAGLRRTLLGRNPFLWLAARDRLRLFGVWLFTVLVFGLAAFAYFKTDGQPGPLIGLCVAVTVTHRFMVAAAGATQLMIEQEQGTLEMLLSTPLTAREVLSGQFRAVVRQFRGPVAIAVFLHLATFAAFMRNDFGNPMAGKLTVCISLASYLFDLYTAAWLSMWGAVIARNPKHAAGAAISRLMGIPLLVILGAGATSTFLNTFFGFGIRLPFESVMVALGLLVVGNNCFWLIHTHRNLPDRLRTYAFRRYTPEEETGFLGSLGRNLGKIYGRASFGRPVRLAQ